MCKNIRRDWQRRNSLRWLCVMTTIIQDPHNKDSQVLKATVVLLMCLLCFGCLLTEVCVGASGTEVSRAPPIREDETFGGHAAAFRAISVETLRNLKAVAEPTCLVIKNTVES